MLEIIRGVINKPVSTDSLIKALQEININEGILYLGYPIIGAIDNKTSIDAVLLSPEHDLVIFDIIETDNFEERKDILDDLYTSINAKLLQNKPLVKDRAHLLVNINTVTYAPLWQNKGYELSEDTATNKDQLQVYLENIKKNRDQEIYKKLVAAVQTVTNLRNRSKRISVTKADSRGEKLKKLEASIANLDSQQSKAVIETVDGIQRIRGLAGSGKTIVLALKVAYLHATHPDWLIGMTFNTRSLKNQFKELITKFTIAQTGEEPNWEQIKIIQAWGSPSAPGIYYEVCKSHNVEYFDYRDANNRFLVSNNDEFDSICKKALDDIKEYKEIYDALLIDEAQDLPESFLKLCYNVLKKPKRLVFAYDELQKLKDSRLRNPKEIFGEEIEFENTEDKPQQDIILEKCYRNSRPILVSAHALGFGIYRKKGLVQMFDQPELWKDLGYFVNSGQLDFGKHVVLERTNETSPQFLENHSPLEDLITFNNFNNFQEQAKWIANEIENTLKNDELEYEDIIVIHSNPLKTKQDTGLLRNLLFKKGINSHLAGVSTSPDDFFSKESITVTSIYRAKGNEGAMIYIMNAQEAFSGLDLMRKRNILFTAITRSKAWVRICGFGEEMELLEEEFKDIKTHHFKLEFNFPTKEELKKINLINRDMTISEQKKIKEINTNLQNLIEGIESGNLHFEDFSGETIEGIKKLLNKNDK